MKEKGYFRVFRDQENPKDIHFQQIQLEQDEVVSDEQLELRDQVDRSLTILQMLFPTEPDKFEEYFRSLLSLAQLGLVGESANPKLAMRALVTLKHEIVSREGGRIKNQYMKKLGKLSLLLGLPSLLGGLLLHNYAPQQLVLGSFLFLWTGCMAGVWISFASRKVVLNFEDLNILEKDRLSPAIRLIFAGLLTVVFGLLISTNAVVLELGGLNANSFADNIQVALLIGVLCGISEQALSTKVAQHTSDLLQLK